MSGGGIASLKTQVAAKVSRERAKELPGFFSPPARPPRVAGGQSALPEWKLGCLVTEYGLPPTVRGSLHFGGCF